MPEPKTRRILLVDDNDLVREFIQVLLEELGYTVHSAATGQQAIEMFRFHPIDLALLDIQMPEMDGYTLCGELRKCRMVPTIFMSAAQDVAYRHHATRVGAADFLPKPFQLHDIAQSIQHALQPA